MKKFVALIGAVLLVSSAGIALARVNPGSPSPLCVTQSPTPGYLENDHQVRAFGSAKVDTLAFGYYTTKPDGLTYALLGGEWNFDPVAEDPLEGWTSIDQTDNDRAYWRQLTVAKWIAEGGSLPWPAMTGNGMALCGATQGHADTLSWVNGVGYGNNWCQRLVSPALTYDGTGTVGLSLKYFSECEPNFDFTKIFVEAAGGRVMLNSPGFTGKIGIDTLGVLNPADYAQTISNLDLGGSTDPHPFQVVIEFVSDGGVSDEDGDSGFNTFYGGVGVDGISLEGANLVPPVTLVYGFEADLEGWVAATCPGIGSFLGLSNMGDYIITDPCSCPLLNNVLEMHNAEQEHPTGSTRDSTRRSSTGRTTSPAGAT